MREGTSGIEVITLTVAVVLVALLLLFVAYSWARPGTLASQATERAVFGYLLATSINALGDADGGQVFWSLKEPVDVQVSGRDVTIAAGGEETTLEDVIMTKTKESALVGVTTICAKRTTDGVEVSAC